jgi:hypothetical protein
LHCRSRCSSARWASGFTIDQAMEKLKQGHGHK